MAHGCPEKHQLRIRAAPPQSHLYRAVTISATCARITEPRGALPSNIEYTASSGEAFLIFAKPVGSGCLWLD